MATAKGIALELQMSQWPVMYVAGMFQGQEFGGRIAIRQKPSRSLTAALVRFLRYLAVQDNAPHHRAAANRPDLQERRGRRLRVHVVVMPFIVALEPRCWIASWSGDPGRTMQEDKAKRFDTAEQAELALKKARKYRRFALAEIVQVDA